MERHLPWRLQYWYYVIIVKLNYSNKLLLLHIVLYFNLNNCIVYLQVVVICHIGLYLFDDMPLPLISIGLGSHLMYYLLLTDFPYFNLNSIKFILSIILLIGNHVLAFKYFRQEYFPLFEVWNFRFKFKSYWYL